MSTTREILSRSPFAVPDQTALAARITLHKDETRSEEMYYYLCFEWERLVTVLTDPAHFFAKLLTPQGGGKPDPKDTLRPPVTACIKPAKPGMKAWVERMAQGGAAQPFAGRRMGDEGVVSSIARMFVESLDLDRGDINDLFEPALRDMTKQDRRVAVMEGLLKLEDGWFLAEFANRTHVITIHYFRPLQPLANRYKAGFTDTTICQIGDEHFGHVHFDLNLKNDDQFEANVAKYIVDLLEDDGRGQCLEMDRKTHVEEGPIEPLFDKFGNLKPPPKSLRKVPRTRKFDTEARQKNCGINLLVEGLSMTKNGLTLDTSLPTFVCSVNEAHLPNGAVVLKDGILKRYSKP